MDPPRKTTDEDGRRLIERCTLFDSLDNDEKRKLVAHAHVRHLHSGETIFLKGSPGEAMMAVLNGEVRISLPSADGKEIVLAIIHSGEVFGELALLDGRDRTADATAVSACDIAVLERRNILPLLQQQPMLCLKLIEMLCDRLRRTTDTVEEAHFLQLRSRLAKVLLRTATRLFSPKGEPHFHVRIQQRELGAMIGGTRESVNKYLGDWQRHGLIQITPMGITILDAAALGAIAVAG